jgi:DNA-binding transcriptional MerR regulator
MAQTPVEIPQKLYFRIGEVSELLGVEPHVVRYWETQFPMLRPSKTSTNHRKYRRPDVEALLKIRRLLYEERFTIAGARQYLEKVALEGERKAKEEANADPARRGLRLVPTSAERDPVQVIRDAMESLLRFLDEDEALAAHAEDGPRGQNIIKR